MLSGSLRKSEHPDWTVCAQIIFGNVWLKIGFRWSLQCDLENNQVTGQFRCATLELCNFDAKQSNLCCIDGFCTNLCSTKADVILTGPWRTK